MYRAKRAGKARCEVSDPAMHANAVKRLRLETNLRKVLDQGHYQPIVKSASATAISLLECKLGAS